MTKFWSPVMAAPVMDAYLALTGGAKPAFSVTNRTAFLAAMRAQEPDTSFRRRAEPYAGLPPAVLRITAAGFSPDYIDDGLIFVSAAFRTAAALDETVADYLPVDASGSTDAVQTKDYRILHVLPERDWLDTDASSFVTLSGPNGEQKQAGVSHAVFRPGVPADVPLFFVPQGRDPYATDAFVETMRATGATGLDFLAV
jgi:hypothetical protein